MSLLVPSAAPRDASVLLADGRSVTLRTVRRADGSALRAFHAALSADSQFQRYLRPYPKLSYRETEWLTNLDHDRHEAIVAFDQGSMIGIAHYDRMRSDDARLTIVVADEYQGRGLGAQMLRDLLGLARSRGVRRARVVVGADNVRMRAAADHSGIPYETERHHDLVHLVFRLAEAGGETP